LRPKLAAFGGCTDGITCGTLTLGNNFTFDCRFGASSASSLNGKVMLLHGFPEWSEMYMPLMRLLGAAGYDTVACNQRGYSPGASPDGVENYSYDLLEDDVFALAAAANFTARWHLVGHDHGAMLGWKCAASARGRSQLLSYSSLSIPHADALSAGLYGPTADIEQQVASQYFTMFVLNNSASLHHDFWYVTLGLTSGGSNTGSFGSAAAFQKALWWYNGAFSTGIVASPPVMSASSLFSHSASMAALRELFGGTPNDGVPATNPIGNVSVPSLFVCGTSDSAIKCNQPYALKTQDYVTANYSYLAVDCGHSVLSCWHSAQTKRVTDAVVAHIGANSARRA